MYAIVDIETTGGQPSGNSITEISIYTYDGDNITGHYETLINPGTPIPRYIQAFTGISDEMVENAPSFNQIAAKIHEVLHDKIFIAHNVNFDYSFVKDHLLRAGYDLNTKRLCTIRLSRKIFPGHPSYSLGNICAAMGIHIKNRHRAGGDAIATVKLFEMLLRNDRDNFIADALKKGSKEQMLPPNLPKDSFEKLPRGSGVYYFLDHKGLAIYVGKAKNIKTRVNSHFSAELNTPQKQNFMRDIHGVSYQQTGNELMASLLEAHEIKRLWPEENRAQKRFQQTYALYEYLDRNGKIRFGIDKARKDMKPLICFPNHASALQYLNTMVEEFGLCPKLCNLQSNPNECISVQTNTCTGFCMVNDNIDAYNKKAEAYLSFLHADKKTYYIVGKGRSNKEQNVIIYEPSALVAYTYVNDSSQFDFDGVKEAAQALKINPTMEGILQGAVDGSLNQKGYKVYTQTQIAVG